MRFDLRGDVVALYLQADAAVEVVLHRGDQQDHDEREEQPVREERKERQPEDVETDVLVEQRIDLIEVHRMCEEQPFVPLTRHAGARDQRQYPGHGDADDARPPIDEEMPRLEQILFGPCRPTGRRDAVGHQEVYPAQHEEDGDEDQGEHDARTEHLAPDLSETKRSEPEEVGVEASDPLQGHR